MAEGVPLYQIIADLRAIKLSDKHREIVVKADETMKKTGGVPDATRTKLRSLHNAHRQAIGKLTEAREKARLSISMDRQGMSLTTVDKLDRERKQKLREKVSDLGF